MKAACALVHVDPSGWMLDVTIKNEALRLIGVYVPNGHFEWPDFQWIEPFLTSSRRLLLEGDWNAALDLDIDRIGA